MSTGRFITKNGSRLEPSAGTANGVWSLQDAIQATKKGDWPSPTYSEDVFSTNIYKGDGSVQILKNNLKLGAGFEETNVSSFPVGYGYPRMIIKNGSSLVSVPNGTNVVYSTDNGATWYLSNFAMALYGGAYFNNAFIVAGVNGIYRSTDNGLNFTTVSSGHNSWVVRVIGSTIFSGKSGASTEPTFMKSTDGITWTSNHTTSNGFKVSDILYNGTTYIAIGYDVGVSVNTPYTLTSSDGVTWSVGSVSGVSGGFTSGCVFNNTFYAMAYHNTNNTTILYSSPNGTSWTQAYQFSSVIPPNVISITSYMIAGDYYSSNGTSWNVYAPGVLAQPGGTPRGGGSLNVSDGELFRCYSSTYCLFRAQVSSFSLGDGGMVWIKGRNVNGSSYIGQIFDTERGNFSYVNSDYVQYGTSYNTSLALGNKSSYFGNWSQINNLNDQYVAWSFKRAPKFFDLKAVTHTTGSYTTVDFPALETIGAVMVRRYDTNDNWYMWHRRLAKENILATTDTLSGWTKNNVLAIKTDDVMHPLATSNSIFKLVNSVTTSGSHTIAFYVETYSDTYPYDRTYTFSFIAKAGDHYCVNCRIYDTSATNYVAGKFDLAKGICDQINVGTGTGASARMEPLGNGWYKCILTGKANPTAGANSVRVQIGTYPTLEYSNVFADTVIGKNYIYVCDPVLNHGFYPEEFTQTTTAPSYNKLYQLTTAGSYVRNDMFRIDGTKISINQSAVTGSYIIYAFAHDNSATGLIKCDQYSALDTYEPVDLGWEPQYLMIRDLPGINSYQSVIYDAVRGMNVDINGTGSPYIGSVYDAYTSETNGAGVGATASGFRVYSSSLAGSSGSKYTFIAVRRKIRPATNASQVFNAIYTTLGTNTEWNIGFQPDMQIFTANGYPNYIVDRVRGVNTKPNSLTNYPAFNIAATADESYSYQYSNNWTQTGFSIPSALSGQSQVFYSFKRSPGFFDIATYTGTGSINQGYDHYDGRWRSVPHNLEVPPELMIFRYRVSNSPHAYWPVYSRNLGTNYWLRMDTTGVRIGIGSSWAKEIRERCDPDAKNLYIGLDNTLNRANETFQVYLFASQAGISKIGTYVGNGGAAGVAGTSQTINCGFTNSARFIMIKLAISTTGLTTSDWYVWDASRGIVDGADLAMRLNVGSTFLSADAVDPISSGFIVNQEAALNLNVTNATYLYMAIA